MNNLTISQVIDILGHVKETGKRNHTLSQEQIDALNLACNILDSRFAGSDNAEETVNWDHWRE